MGALPKILAIASIGLLSGEYVSAHLGKSFQNVPGTTMMGISCDKNLPGLDFIVAEVLRER
jgi:hypothetical protein